MRLPCMVGPMAHRSRARHAVLWRAESGVYLYGKAFGPDAMMQSGAYRPELSLHRIFAFEKASMDSLFLTWQTFNWQGVVFVWLLLAYLAWRRPRPVLRFCWIFLMLPPRCRSPCWKARGAACLYIPLAGWAVFAAIVLTDPAARPRVFCRTNRSSAAPVSCPAYSPRLLSPRSLRGRRKMTTGRRNFVRHRAGGCRQTDRRWCSIRCAR